MQPTTANRTGVSHRGAVWLWFAIFAGPLAWAADFALSYGLTTKACSVQSSAFLLLFSALAFGTAVAGLLAALRAKRERHSSMGNGEQMRADPRQFLVVSGIVMSGAFQFVIVAGAIPRLLVNPCI